MPEPGSRRLNAGRRLGSRQASPRLIPRQSCNLGFDVVYEISTRHRPVYFRSSSWFTPDAITSRLFRNAQHERLLTAAPCGGLRPPPARRPRGTSPHHPCSTASSWPFMTSLPRFTAQQLLLVDPSMTFPVTRLTDALHRRFSLRSNRTLPTSTRTGERPCDEPGHTTRGSVESATA